MSGLRFSANLGFLWPELPLPDRILAAARAGFDAVECHFPYDVPVAETLHTLRAAGLPMLALNTRPGDLAAGDFGLCALPGRETEARDAIAEAIDYAAAIGAGMVHVMAGKAEGCEGAAETFRANLDHALRLAAPHGITVLVEPINTRDVPGYFLNRLEDAVALAGAFGARGLRIMFDCYHMQIAGGDIVTRFRPHAAAIGHVQIASVPARAAPDTGEIDYRWLLPALRDAGYDGFFGAEYRPGGPTDAGLGWMAAFRDA